jgi:hypothetical protein
MAALRSVRSRRSAASRWRDERAESHAVRRPPDGTRDALPWMTPLLRQEHAMLTSPSVLCPVDLSDASRGALRYAAALAEHFYGGMTVLTVDDPSDRRGRCCPRRGLDGRPDPPGPREICRRRLSGRETAPPRVAPDGRNRAAGRSPISTSASSSPRCRHGCALRWPSVPGIQPPNSRVSRQTPRPGRS